MKDGCIDEEMHQKINATQNLRKKQTIESAVLQLNDEKREERHKTQERERLTKHNALYQAPAAKC